MIVGGMLLPAGPRCRMTTSENYATDNFFNSLAEVSGHDHCLEVC